ncbi:MAG: aminoglycoside phosphotransferase family protein [Ilumatobacteraceae bacterium]
MVVGDGFGVPPLVRQCALAAGDVGRRWLADLPRVVARLRDAWELELGSVYRGGTAGFVVAARDRFGTDVVLKVAMPLDDEEIAGFARSVAVHRLADGRGCARLLAHDDGMSALLLERLGPNLDELAVPLDELLQIVAATLRSFWRPVDERVALPTGAEKAAWLSRLIVTTWEQLGRPCSRELIDRAVRCCDERAASFDWRRAVLVHGDAHGWNTVSTGDGGHKFVDPEGLWSEPEHDLGVPMREYNAALLAGDTSRLVRLRAESLAAACDADPEAVWQWGFVERVSTGLVNLRDFTGAADAAAFLSVAERSR